MLREQGRNDINFLELTDVSFAEFRKQLDGRMKELTNQGKNSQVLLEVF